MLDARQLGAQGSCNLARLWGYTQALRGAPGALIAELAAGNVAYEERFGFIFIVCASGLSAAEMKARLDQRMPHSPENEIRIAAGEQAKITALRLNKWESE